MTTTGQVPALSPLLTRTRQQNYGAILGRDLLTNQAVSGSPRSLYMADQVSATNVCVLGAVGVAKSTLVKSFYVTRAVALGERVAVFDRKQQWQDGSFGGEYLRVARALNGAVLRFAPMVEDESGQRVRVGARLNLLDPAMSATSGGKGSPMGQGDLLRMLVEATMERRLTPEENWALSVAHRRTLQAARTQGRTPVLGDLVAALYNLDDAAVVPGGCDDAGNAILANRGLVTAGDVTKWGLPIALVLEDFIREGRYAGLFDGETAGPPSADHPDGTPIDLAEHLIVIDTSDIPSGSLLLSVVMTITASYLAARWARMPGSKTLVVEEAYSADKLGVVPAVFRDLVKRSRGVGMGVVTVFHHTTDVEKGSPLWSLMRECEIVHIFRQDKDDDAREVIQMYGLPDTLERTIRTLPKGVHIYLRGRLPTTIVRLIRTDFEAELSDTDAAMRFRHAREPVHLATDDQLAHAVRELDKEDHTRTRPRTDWDTQA